MSPVTVWFTGLPSSGKTTLAEGLREVLLSEGQPAHVLDGDVLRTGLTSDLGFSREDRAESVRRAGEAALILTQAGVVSLVSLVSPYQVDRNRVRRRHQEMGLGFLEVHVATPLEICRSRDTKGLYRRAYAGELVGMTGVDDPYENPSQPDLVCGHPAPLDRDIAATLVRLRPLMVAFIRGRGAPSVAMGITPHEVKDEGCIRPV